MFADIRRLAVLYDDVPTPEAFAKPSMPFSTPNIEYGDAASYTLSKYGACSRTNGRYLCSQWCDDTFPVDSNGLNQCDRAASTAIHT